MKFSSWDSYASGQGGSMYSWVVPYDVSWGYLQHYRPTRVRGMGDDTAWYADLQPMDGLPSKEMNLWPTPRTDPLESTMPTGGPYADSAPEETDWDSVSMPDLRAAASDGATLAIDEILEAVNNKIMGLPLDCEALRCMILSKASSNSIEDRPRFDLADLKMVHEIGAFDFNPTNPGGFPGDISEPQVNTGILLAKHVIYVSRHHDHFQYYETYEHFFQDPWFS